jgi:drug/metabolite transporter (DMT)-like permease
MLEKSNRRSRLPEVILVLVTLVWGATFLASQAALADSGPFGLLATRFTLGAGVLFLVFFRRMRGVTRAEWRAGVAIGVVTFASYALQTTGLQHILSSKSAFITSLYVPLVPLLQLAILRVAPRAASWLGIGLAFAGLLLLSTGDGFAVQLGVGEWLTLGSAATAALQIVLISRWAPAADPMRLATVQLGMVALLSLVAIPLSGEALPGASATFLIPALGLGLLGTAFAIGAMNWAQRTVSATRATVIYAMEPVWAGVFGVAAGEIITRPMLAGSALILVGIVVSELRLEVIRTIGERLQAIRARLRERATGPARGTAGSTAPGTSAALRVSEWRPVDD